MVSISVIIVNYNARYFLKNCIVSVLRSDISDDIEIIVVDNNSADGSYDMLQRDFPEVKCIRNLENKGFSKANNQGVELARGAYVLILNPDTILGESTLSEVLSFSRKQVDFGASGVRFIDGSGTFLPESKRNFPGLKIAGAKLLGYSKNYYANQIGEEAIAESEILTGAFMFVKRSVFEKVGGFDEDFFMYGEDIDLSYRITQAGYKNFYMGSVRVIHFKGESTVKDNLYLTNFYGALSIFYKKHFPHSRVFYRAIDWLISGLIKMKSVAKATDEQVPLTFHSWVCLGHDEKVFNRIKIKFPRASGRLLSSLDDRISESEVVFFDMGSLSCGEIIEGMSHPALAEVKKRIISEDHSFYLGSDVSFERGEVMAL